MQQSHTRKINLHRKKTMKRGVLPISRLYEGQSGFNVNIPNLDGHSTTYGEVKESSIPILYEIFNTYAPLSKISLPYRNFYDLGSGIGKLAIGMCYLNSTLKSTGIEIVPDRVQIANAVLQKIRDASVKKRIENLCLSMLDDTIHYSDACWIFISNLTMSDEHNKSIFEKLAKEVKQGCIVVCSKAAGNSSFKELNNVSLPMSWSDESKVYIYAKI
jgi:SAM-dependent methyltransferase